MRKVTSNLFLTTLFLTSILPGLTQAAPGNLDPSFGTGGIVTTPITTSGTFDANAYAIAIQPDGKLVTAGLSYSYNSNFTVLTSVFALARYNTNGNLDTTFGNGGIVTTAIGATDDTAQAVVIQPDGKIVAAGNSDASTSDSSAYRFALVRYNSDGTLDPTFGNGGIVTTVVGANAGAFGLALQGGKLVAAGFSDNRFAAVRYNADGSRDSTFGIGGIVTTPIGVNDTARAVAIQSNGKIVVAGSTNNGIDYDFAVVRYQTDGSLDTTFNPTGSISNVPGVAITDFTDLDDEAFAVDIQVDGKLVVAGHTNTGASRFEFALARYDTDGSLDSTFGTGGKVSTPIRAVHDSARAVALQGSKIVAVGFSDRGAFLYDFAVARYNSDGSLDPTFGTGGIVTTDIGTGPDFFRAVAIQQDGKIVAAGSASGLQHYGFALVRYLDGPGQPPTAVSLTPVNITTVPSVVQSFTAVYSDPDGWQNISDASLTLSGSTHTEALHYSPATNKFILLGASGDCSPGNGATLTNGFLNLNCGASNISGSGNTLTITFSLTPQPSLSGAPYLLGIAAIDQGGASNSKTVGYWVVNRRPNANSVSPMNSSTPAGTAQTFISVYSDPDGWQNIAAANFYLSGNGGAHNEWLHYLVAPNQFTMLGTNDVCSPGQVKTISNGFLTLNCGASSISGSGTVLTVTFRVTPQPSSSGIQYNIFMAASDQAAAAYAIFAGTWQIQ